MSYGNSPGMFINALPLLDNARQTLGPGEMVYDERLSLMDLMSAVEIMDARTDSFLAARTKPRLAADSIANFDPARELLPWEVVHIMDEVLRLEATFLDGHPLGLTLFTCRYLRPNALRSLTNTAASSHGMRQVLRALLLGVIKSAEIVWEELAKGQVYEHEDVHLAMASLSFSELLASCYPLTKRGPSMVLPGQQRPSSPEDRLVTVEDVLQALTEAEMIVSKYSATDETSKRVLQQLGLRIRMRIEWIWATALLTSPPHADARTILERLESSQTCLGNFSEDRYIQGETARLDAAFSKDVELPLPSPQPPRDIQALAFSEACVFMDRLIRCLSAACKLWENWIEKKDWEQVTEYHDYMSRQASDQPAPYVRSLQQTLVMTSRSLFGDSQPIELASSFFQSLASVPLEIWDNLIDRRAVETTWDGPARRILGWLDKVANELVQSLAARCQNRARQRRLLVKRLPQTLYLIDELESLSTSWQDVVPSVSIGRLAMALRVHALGEVLEVLLMGFELGLYEREEWDRVWWVAERVARRIEVELESADPDDMASDYAKTRLKEASAIKNMCRASCLMSFCDSTPVLIMSSPLLHISDDHARDRDRFHQRFRWLQGSLGAVSPSLESVADWIEYVAGRNEAREIQTATLLVDPEMAFEVARSSIDALATLSSKEGRSQKTRDLFASMRQCAGANVNTLQEYKSNVHQDTSRWKLTCRWDSAWFPTWRLSE